MSYSDVLDTKGRYRVMLVADECADEPYDDGASPLLRIDGKYDYTRAEHVMATGRPTGDDGRIEEAVRRWGSPSSDDWPLVEKYLRAFYGTTQIVTWYSGNYWYVTYDTAAWRAYVGWTDASPMPPGAVNMGEYRAWCEGDVWGWVTQKLVTWHTADPDYADEIRWEDVNSCFGYYGYEWAEQTAREELAALVKASQVPVTGRAGWRARLRAMAGASA